MDSTSKKLMFVKYLRRGDVLKLGLVCGHRHHVIELYEDKTWKLGHFEDITEYIHRDEVTQ